MLLFGLDLVLIGALRAVKVREIVGTERQGEQKMDKQEVVVVDIKIPFWSMVILIVKWAVAAIPAFIILYLVAFVLFGLPNFLARP